MAANEMTSHERAADRRIDAVAWGLFFVWIGIALLTRVGWGVGLVGVGALTLGAQAWRKYVGVRVDRFSLVVGALFALIGIWNLFQVRVELVPLLFIAVGVALLTSTWRTRTSGGGTDAGAPAHPRA